MSTVPGGIAARSSLRSSKYRCLAAMIDRPFPQVPGSSSASDGLSRQGARPRLPAIGTDRVTHLLVEGEHTRVVGAAHQIEPVKVWPVVAVEVGAWHLGRSLRG